MLTRLFLDRGAESGADWNKLNPLRGEAAMQEELPEEIARALARKSERARAAKRLRVETGESWFPVRRHWRGGFALSEAHGRKLRGYVDLYEGPSHLMRCLILAARTEDGETEFEVQQINPVAVAPAADHVLDAPPPAGLLPAAGRKAAAFMRRATGRGAEI